MTLNCDPQALLAVDDSGRVAMADGQSRWPPASSIPGRHRMISARAGVCAVVTMIALLRPLSAQQSPLTLGRWVRVTSSADGETRRGRLLLILPDTVVIDDGRTISQNLEYVPVGSSVRLDLPTHIRAHPVEGALVGAGVGMAVGALSYSLRSMFTCADVVCPRPAGQLIGRAGRVVVGGLAGLAIGALVGRHVYTTRWVPVPPDQLDRLRVAVVPGPGGRLGLGATLEF